MTANRVHHKRRIKLIKPKLQLKLVGIFVGVSAVGFLLQSLVVGLRLSETASTIPEGGPYLMALLPRLPLEILLFSFGMLLPLTIATGVLATFRIAGPVYRFERYLTNVIEGRESEPCRLRSGDELQELCRLINEATEPVRAARHGARAKEDGAPDEPAAAPEPWRAAG